MHEINYRKIIIKTFLKVLAMIIVIFFLNSWPLIKQSFSGEIPKLSYWLDHSFKLSNIVLIVGFGCYFLYKSLSEERELMASKTDEN